MSSANRRKVHKFRLSQLLEFGMFSTSWKEVDVTSAQRVITDRDTGKPVGLSRNGFSVGYSVHSAAKELGVSRQRVHQLLDAGKLEGYELLDDADHPTGLFITYASLQACLGSERKPGPRSKLEK